MREFINADCMQYMPKYPDNYFDLAIVDPPYGIGYDIKAQKRAGQKSKGGAAYKKQYHASNWDNQTPDAYYFNELLRIAKHQIIWGGNYFTNYLPPSKAFICWDKRLNGMQRSFADCELAWMDKGLGVARMFRYVWDGMLQEDMANKEERIHPTQKPVALYKWLLSNYAKQGDLILDTHVGSASSLVACEEMGFNYVGFEIDETYYKMAKQRIEEFNQQMRMEL